MEEDDHSALLFHDQYYYQMNNNNNTCDSRAFVAASEEPTFSRPAAEIICSSHGMHTSFSPPSINNNIPEKRKPAPTTAHAQDHVLAERKRREKLSQRFIALSALLPGLKKVRPILNMIKLSINLKA